MADEADIASPSTSATLDPISQRLKSLQLAAGERRGGGGFRWGRIIVPLLLVALGIGGYLGYEEYRKAQIEVIPETEAVTFGERSGGGVILDVSGYIVPRTKIHISPQSAGKIVSLPFEEGTTFKKGDVVCKIEDDIYQAELTRAKATLALAEAGVLKLKNGARPEEIEQAETQVASAEIAAREAKENLDRVTQLRKSNSVPQAEFETALASYQTAGHSKIAAEASLRLIKSGAREEDIATAQAQVDQAKASVLNAEINVANTVITAPCDGVILEKNAQEGELILPQTVITSLCILADMNELEAEVDIQEREVSRLKVGHPCQVVPDAYPDRIYEAELVRVQPQVNRARGVVPAKVRILKPDENLLADMNCRVLFRKREEAVEVSLPTLPSRAVEIKDGSASVFVLEKQLARKRPVKVGKTLGDEVEIAEGLKKGEVVLLRGKEPIVDGQTIRPKLLEADPATEGAS